LNHLSFKTFTPGPTPISKHILEIANYQLPYNRTQNFSELTFEILSSLKYIFQTSSDVIILTASGTGAMEATTLGFLNSKDKVLIINGGTFGQRWVNLCERFEIPFEEIHLKPGKNIDPEIIDQYLKSSTFTALLMNAHETSTGILYDVEQIGGIANRHKVFFIVDAISSICADTFLMDEWFVDVALLSSQKALALPPGLSFIALNERAKERLISNERKSFYFDLLDYLENQKRGQMPFTPAISLFLMLRQRLEDITQEGMETVVSRHRILAQYFRKEIEELPFSILPERQSNAMTALKCDERINASDLVAHLSENHNIFLAPNGGDLKSRVFRVSHMGEQTTGDIGELVQALRKTVLEVGKF